MLIGVINISIAHFEKVSLSEYLACRIPPELQSYDDAGNNKLTEFFTNEWENIKLPTRSTDGSAGYDFYCPSRHTIWKQPTTIETGIRCRIEPGWALFLFPRSGLGFRYGMRLNNSVGIVDSDYYNADNEGHIKARIYATDSSLTIDPGDRFMQGVFLPYGLADNGNLGGDRMGGFGSTGR